MNQGIGAGTELRILGKKHMHMSIEEQIVSKQSKTPSKQNIHRMNSSFATNKSSENNRESTSDDNLPSIGVGQETAKGSSGIFVHKGSCKLKNWQNIVKSAKQTNFGRLNTWEMENKKSNKSILNSLKSNGCLKWVPKLWVDVPMTVERIKHNPKCFENDNKWTYQILDKEDYQRREQVKKLDSSGVCQVVYDHMEKSPFYNDPNNPYFNEKKLLQSKNNTGFMQQRSRQRGFRRPMINSGIPKKDKMYTSLNPYYILGDETDSTLIFESRFECGNLKKATKVEEFEYDLTVHSDYNSQGYSQWFYFRVTNIKANTKYFFNIFNFYKPDSLYNQGMRPLMYSKKKEEKFGVGWMRVGEDVCYYQNMTKRKSGYGYFYSLSFSFEVEYDDDEVYFCHWFPYSYRDWKEFLEKIWSDNKKGNNFY